LVFVEVAGGVATPGTLALIHKARQLEGAAAAVVCGPDAAGVAAGLARYGADEAWFTDGPALEPEVAIGYADAVATLIAARGVTTVLFENSVLAADVAAILAARLEAGVNWDLQDIVVRDGALVGSRLAFNDALSVEVGWTGAPRLAVFRVGTFEPVEQPVDGRVERFDVVTADPSHAGVSVVERRATTSADEARLATAEIIVAGGRGLRDRESLGLIEDLADALGGAVGVSLPLVDRGWYPYRHQVGQTGQKVRPRLYLACGISGALAHRVGMEKAGVIVAINSDPSAPIFGICDAGVVGDLYEVVPELTRLVREARGTAVRSPGA